MSRSSTLILLGVLIVLLPFSGLPIAIRTFLTVAFGATVLGVGISMRAENARASRAAPPAPVAPPTPSSL